MRGWLPALAWLSGGLVAFAAAVFVAWFGGVGPWGPFPGGILWGEVSSKPVADWSFADRVTEVQVETRLGPLPWSVTTWALTHDGRLYLPSRNCLEKRWVKNLLETSRAHFVAAPERHPGTQIQHVFFRVDPP